MFPPSPREFPQDRLHPHRQGFRGLPADPLPGRRDDPEGELPSPIEKFRHLPRVEQQGVGVLESVEREIPNLRRQDQAPVRVRAAVDPAKDVGQTLEDFVQGSHHLFPGKGEDRGPEGGEIRLVDDEDDVRGEPRKLPDLPLGDPEEVFHENIPAQGVVIKRAPPAVGDHEAEGNGSGDLPLHCRVGSSRKREEPIEAGGPLRRDGERAQFLREVAGVEFFRLGHHRIAQLHEELLPREVRCRQPGGELDVHVLEERPPGKLGPVRYGGTPGQNGANRPVGVVVRQAAHARGEEGSREIHHRPAPGERTFR
jgi:hypothetical protein